MISQTQNHDSSDPPNQSTDIMSELSPLTGTLAPRVGKAHHAPRFIIPAIDADEPVAFDMEGEHIPSEKDDDHFQDFIEYGLDGDGIGSEDYAGQDGDELDPAIQEIRDSLSPQHKPMPIWLQDEVAKKIDFLKKVDSTGSFWLPMKCGWFKMNNSRRMYPSLLYNPRFFYWDPLYLVKIKCPNCRTPLTRHGGIFKCPRRCFDVNGLFFMLGARYKCSQCTKSLNKDAQKTFMSWDSHIQAGLPYALACEFPCVLTHHSAISQDTFTLERALITAGLRTNQISDIFRLISLQKYDLKHSQYLETINYTRLAPPWSNAPYPAFSSFDDPEDYAGFVPSSQWLQDLFDDFVEKHTAHINQFTSMLSAEICAIDHSHKITKHIIQVNGVPVFIGLLTVTNDMEEIRVLALVATKAHSQFEIALKRMSDSLRLYGHCQPKLFYTDDLKDKGFLERTFESLLEGVQPINKFSHLPILTLPGKWTIVVKSTATQIQQVLGVIRDDVANMSTKSIVVGLDVEWNVDLTPGHSWQGKSAVVAIAYGT